MNPLKYFIHGWGTSKIDYLTLALIGFFAVYVVVFTIQRYRLNFPPWRPLALLAFAYWDIGMLFGGLYGITWHFNPGAFKGLQTASNWEFCYFSFVTLTTLGYGDITPASYLARWLALVEACCGLFFIAVLIAILMNNKADTSNRTI